MKLEGKEFLGPLELDSEAIPASRAVYFISAGDEPLYIGLASNLRLRMRQHLKRSTFGKIETPPYLYYWPFDETQILLARELESLLILKIQPKLNKMLTHQEISNTYNQSIKVENANKLTSIAAAVTASVTIALTASMLFGILKDKTKPESVTIENRIKQIENSQLLQLKEVSNLSLTIKSIQSSLESIDSKKQTIADNRELFRISSDVKILETKISALEIALNSDPAKTLAVPLLRKDLDNTRDNFKTNLDHTKSEIDRIYDQNKWFIGLMFTIAISVLGMAASNFLSRKDSRNLSIDS